MRKVLSKIRLALMSIAICACLSILASAQTVSGTMQGRITDSNGAVVTGATIVVKNKETGQTRTVISNDEGFYSAPFLPIGAYTVEATRNDFNKVVKDGIQVPLNDTAVVNFQLDPTVKGEVVVVADAPIINTTNAQIAGNLTSDQISEKPVSNQSNFLTLAETFTGFQENPTSGQNNPTASSGSSVNFNGTGTRGATFQINGVNNDDSSENQNRQGASLATIKEFQVITNNFTAEFGRGYGAVVLVQTKQGTNRYSGEAYWYHNDSALNANSWFNNLSGTRKPVDRRNQFGGVFGFPIFKNKLFGFVSLDHIEETGGAGIRRDVFTQAEIDQANALPASPNKTFIQSVIARFGDLRPNSPAVNFRSWAGVQNRDFPARDYTGRFDWNVTKDDTVTGRWQYTRQIFKASEVIIGERADQNHHQNSGGLTWTHIFSPNFVGEFRYGLGLRTTLVNIAAGNNTPIIRFVGTPGTGSTIGNAGAFPIQRYQTDNQFVYNISAVLGSNHFLKAGTDIRRQKLDDFADNFSRGFWNFSASCNGTTYATAYAAFLAGCVNNFQRGYGPFFLENRINESNFYVEDNWRVFSNLTFNLGFRYEYVSAPTEKAGRINYGFTDDKNNWEPRVGFAYTPDLGESWLAKKLFGKPGDFVMRGGYGIYHGRLFQSVFSQGGATVRFNPPNAIFLNLTGNTTAAFHPLDLPDPTNGFVFTPGPQTARHAESIIDPGLEMPYTQQWNMTFERQLPWKSAIRISYTGNRGIGLLRFALDNLPSNDPSGVLVANHPNNAPGVLYSGLAAGDPRLVDVRGQTLRLAADFLCAGTGLTGVATNATCPNAVPLGNLEYSFRVPRTNERRPNGAFTTNTAVSNGAWSYYHGLQIEITKRLSEGLNFQAAYTFSKSIDTTSEATAVGTGDSNQTGNGTRISRGLSRFHTPHRFTLFGTYRLPFFNKRTDWIGQFLGGWVASMVVKASHGTPFTVINGTGADLNLDGFAETRPVLIDPNIYGRSIDNRDSAPFQLPRTAFRAPTVADFGCCVLGRNTFFVDGQENVDFAFSKVFPLWFEGHRLTVRADVFNAFNHIQFGFPNPDFTAAAFGTITTAANAYTPRRIQVSLRYNF
jgi:outer membrane receptor protein involved in Fe transport